MPGMAHARGGTSRSALHGATCALLALALALASTASGQPTTPIADARAAQALQRGYWVVEPGDHLYRIARHFATTEDEARRLANELKQLNDHAIMSNDASKLVVGARIRLPKRLLGEPEPATSIAAAAPDRIDPAGNRTVRNNLATGAACRTRLASSTRAAHPTSAVACTRRGAAFGRPAARRGRPRARAAGRGGTCSAGLRRSRARLLRRRSRARARRPRARRHAGPAPVGGGVAHRESPPLEFGNQPRRGHRRALREWKPSVSATSPCWASSRTSSPPADDPKGERTRATGHVAARQLRARRRLHGEQRAGRDPPAVPDLAHDVVPRDLRAVAALRRADGDHLARQRPARVAWARSASSSGQGIQQFERTSGEQAAASYAHRLGPDWSVGGAAIAVRDSTFIRDHTTASIGVNATPVPRIPRGSCRSRSPTRARRPAWFDARVRIGPAAAALRRLLRRSRFHLRRERLRARRARRLLARRVSRRAGTSTASAPRGRRTT